MIRGSFGGGPRGVLGPLLPEGRIGGRWGAVVPNWVNPGWEEKLQSTIIVEFGSGEELAIVWRGRKVGRGVGLECPKSISASVSIWRVGVRVEVRSLENRGGKG